MLLLDGAYGLVTSVAHSSRLPSLVMLLRLVCKLLLLLTRLLVNYLLLLHSRWLLTSVETANHVGGSSLSFVQEVFVLTGVLLG